MVYNQKTANKMIVRAGAKDNFNSNIVAVIINPTDICNFNCEYCCNKYSKKKQRTLPLETLKSFIEDLAIRNADKYIFNITGGEPLLYKYKYELLQLIAKYIPNQKHVNFITNGVLIPKNEELIDIFSDSIKLKFYISMHYNQIPIDKYITIIQSIKNKNLIECKIMLNPGQLEIVYRIEKILKLIGITTHITSIFGAGSKIIDYPENELKFLNLYPGSNSVIAFHEYMINNNIVCSEYTMHDKRIKPEEFSYKSLYCSAGLNTLRLGPNGDIIPCFGWLRSKGTFNINNVRLRDIPELNSPCICPASRCNCQPFIQTPKWKTLNFAPKYIRRLYEEKCIYSPPDKI